MLMVLACDPISNVQANTHFPNVFVCARLRVDLFSRNQQTYPRIQNIREEGKRSQGKKRVSSIARPISHVCMW